MSSLKSYLLDTNIYIQSWNLWHPKSVFPGYWEWMLHEHKIKQFQTIDKVLEELKHYDGIEEWKNQIKEVSTKTTDNIVDPLRTVLQVVYNHTSQGKKYTQRAITEFENCADSYLIAYALANHLDIVTEETFEERCLKRIKIPNICRKLNIRTLTLPQLLREVNPEFLWNGNKATTP
ncbi:MAG: DUF4411 family protein [Planctomycetia bacterium]|nr:DUF4411 family protein [Planctomycetia bacterium]